jgi:FMN-dependent oxidoreductase (nitrilotriacetate monooxygenase family)
MRQMTLVAFLQAQNCTNLPCSWRHPQSRTDAWSAEYYRHIGRVLEEGKFHLGFFDDRLSMPDIYGHDHAHTVQHGIRCVKMDAVTVLTVMGMATERLGLGATYSTSYYEPFHVARLFATLDLMTDGRAAWNVVTSLNDGEAQNMGRDEVIEHDLRYDRADEFMEVVFGHWDSWEDDAIVQDKARGLFAHPDKVHRLDHKGPFFRSRGPFTVPRSRQGRPVIIQAGQSGRGKRFGAQWGELIFGRLSEHRGRQARLCGIQGGGSRLRPQSGGGHDHASDHHGGCREQDGSRGQMGPHR